MQTGLERLTKELGPSVLSIVLFGSRARNEARVDSDADILVVLHKLDPRLGQRIIERAQAVSSQIGLHISPLVLTLDDCRKASGQKRALLSEILRDGKVVFGRGLKELMHGKNA